jgi:ferritin-like metal-binding protein YciE
MLAENLSGLFQRHLELALDDEHHMAKELPNLIAASSSAHFRGALEQSLEQSKVHQQRLEQVFASLHRAAATETDHAIRNLMSETEKLIKHIDRSPLLDSALIIVVNQAGHNGTARYGALVSLARLQSLDEAAMLLTQTLVDKKTTDQTFTELAVKLINPEAVGFQNSQPSRFVFL